jgi:hypothetical protein
MLALLKIIAELIHWLRIEAEIRSRRMLQSELEKTDEALDSLEDDIYNARRANQHELADRLLAKRVRAVGYRSGLLSIEERRILRSDDGRGGLGISVRDSDERRTDNGPVASK